MTHVRPEHLISGTAGDPARRALLTMGASMLLLVNGSAAPGDYEYISTNQTVTITKYLGPGGAVIIPDSIDSLPVTAIGADAFDWCATLTSVKIPETVTYIGHSAFRHCGKLSSVSIPGSVVSIDDYAFAGGTNLASIIIPASVSQMGGWVFYLSTRLTAVCFQGNCPVVNPNVLTGADKVTVFYLPGATRWGRTLGGRPTAHWSLPYPIILNNHISTGGFGFTISWATNKSVIVEASTDRASPVWFPVSTNELTNGSSDFTDLSSTHNSARFYRLRANVN